MNKRIFILAGILFLFALFVNLYSFKSQIPLKRPLDSLPMQWKGWAGNDYFFDEIILDRLGVNEYMMREYRKENRKVSMYIGYYGSQKKGSQIHSPKHCLPGSGWLILSEKEGSLTIKDVGEVHYVNAVYQKGEDKEVFYYWYKMKDEYITNEYVLKLYMILNSLRYGRNDAAFIRLSGSFGENENNSMLTIKSFMQDFLPLLKDYLPD
ncbi:MAG: hypothetical protein AMK70_11815 [Nitrospira bacterium SG8_35_1]|nr:MAG: hypothetical protein AMK70_11815 [Nitrospira bacterium SG8_35_1]